MLPSAQTDCSWTFSFGLPNNSMKIPTAPASMTFRVWSDDPDAIFVSAHEASN